MLFGHKTIYLDYEDLKIAPSIAFFIDHEKDVLKCSISADNGQIVSLGIDGTIKIWNTVGQVKCTVHIEFNVITLESQSQPAIIIKSKCKLLDLNIIYIYIYIYPLVSE